MRRKSFAKYKIAASVNSPNDALNTPLPFVSGTGLAISSGNSVLSRPTERECTHRKFGQIPNTFRNSASEPDQLKSTLASAAACSNASTESPATVFTPVSCICSVASCGSAGSARTRMVSVLMGSSGEAITPQSRRALSNKRSLEKSNQMFNAQNLTLQIRASYNTPLSSEYWLLTARFQSSTVYRTSSRVSEGILCRQEIPSH